MTLTKKIQSNSHTDKQKTDNSDKNKQKTNHSDIDKGKPSHSNEDNQKSSGSDRCRQKLTSCDSGKQQEANSTNKDTKDDGENTCTSVSAHNIIDNNSSTTGSKDSSTTGSGLHKMSEEEWYNKLLSLNPSLKIQGKEATQPSQTPCTQLDSSQSSGAQSASSQKGTQRKSSKGMRSRQKLSQYIKEKLKQIKKTSSPKVNFNQQQNITMNINSPAPQNIPVNINPCRPQTIPMNVNPPPPPFRVVSSYPPSTQTLLPFTPPSPLLPPYCAATPVNYNCSQYPSLPQMNYSASVTTQLNYIQPGTSQMTDADWHNTFLGIIPSQTPQNYSQPQVTYSHPPVLSEAAQVKKSEPAAPPAKECHPVSSNKSDIEWFNKILGVKSSSVTEAKAPGTSWQAPPPPLTGHSPVPGSVLPEQKPSQIMVENEPSYRPISGVGSNTEKNKASCISPALGSEAAPKETRDITHNPSKRRPVSPMSRHVLDMSPSKEKSSIYHLFTKSRDKVRSAGRSTSKDRRGPPRDKKSYSRDRSLSRGRRSISRGKDSYSRNRSLSRERRSISRDRRSTSRNRRFPAKNMSSGRRGSVSRASRSVSRGRTPPSRSRLFPRDKSSVSRYRRSPNGSSSSASSSPASRGRSRWSSKIHKHRSSSDARKHSSKAKLHSQEDKVQDDMVREALLTLRSVHEKECEKYRSNPVIHPDFGVEYVRFCEKKTKSILGLGGDPSQYDMSREWRAVWLKRIEEIFEESWKVKKKQCLDALNAYMRTPSPESVSRRHRSYSPSSHYSSSSTSSYNNPIPKRSKRGTKKRRSSRSIEEKERKYKKRETVELSYPKAERKKRRRSRSISLEEERNLDINRKYKETSPAKRHKERFHGSREREDNTAMENAGSSSKERTHIDMEDWRKKEDKVYKNQSIDKHHQDQLHGSKNVIKDLILMEDPHSKTINETEKSDNQQQEYDLNSVIKDLVLLEEEFKAQQQQKAAHLFKTEPHTTMPAIHHQSVGTKAPQKPNTSVKVCNSPPKTRDHTSATKSNKFEEFPTTTTTTAITAATTTTVKCDSKVGKKSIMDIFKSFALESNSKPSVTGLKQNTKEYKSNTSSTQGPREIFFPDKSQNKTKVDIDVVNILEVLTHLGDKLGGLYAPLSMMFEQAKKLQADDADPMMAISDAHNQTLLQMIHDKLKVIMNDGQLSIIKKAIVEEADQRLCVLLEQHKLSSFSEDLDLGHLARQCLGMDPAKTIASISEVLQSRGQVKPTQQQLMQLFMSVKEEQLKMMGERHNTNAAATSHLVSMKSPTSGAASHPPSHTEEWWSHEGESTSHHTHHLSKDKNTKRIQDIHPHKQQQQQSTKYECKKPIRLTLPKQQPQKSLVLPYNPFMGEESDGDDQ